MIHRFFQGLAVAHWQDLTEAMQYAIFCAICAHDQLDACAVEFQDERHTAPANYLSCIDACHTCTQAKELLALV
jgi:hypothetical protein